MTRFPTARPEMGVADDLIAGFKRCLDIVSGARASWDAYDRSASARAAGNRAEAEALRSARAIWSDNPALHDDLRAAFTAAQPLATMREIEQPVLRQAAKQAEQSA